MAVNGIALGTIAAGTVFAYAGITGKSVLKSVQAVVMGKSPALLSVDYPVTGQAANAAALAASSASTVGGTGSVMITGGTFINEVLSGIGAPLTSANQSSMASWIQREGGGGQNNPLNTTQPMPGSTSFNSVNVQNYASPQDGATATVATLNNGRYGDILLLLKSGQGLCGHTLQGLSTWSGGGYSSVC